MEGSVVSKNIEFLTIDSGACENIVPASCFPHTPLLRAADFGSHYGACGGETVTNIGEKKVTCLTTENEITQIEFQVGDKITRSLVAVSKLCEAGCTVQFGPAPQYESHIDLPSGARIPIALQNGTYKMPVKEVVFKPNMANMEDAMFKVQVTMLSQIFNCCRNIFFLSIEINYSIFVLRTATNMS